MLISHKVTLKLGWHNNCSLTWKKTKIRVFRDELGKNFTEGCI